MSCSRGIALAVACAALAACASAPPSGSATPASPAARAAPASQGTPGTVQAEKLASLQAWARNSGYKPYTKDGQPFWCKNEAQLGSHLGRVRCVSQDALADLEQQSLDSQRSLSEREHVCAGGDCNKTQ